MPTYDYQCDACGHTFEEFQSMKDEPLKKCPACKKNKLRRLIGTGAAVLFKGSGFYQTDYRSDSYKQAAKADSGGGSNGSSAKSEKSDAAPAPKAEAKDSGSTGKKTKSDK